MGAAASRKPLITERKVRSQSECPSGPFPAISSSSGFKHAEAGPMLVGVPKEIKDNEFRVGMTPAAVAELVHHGHQVIVETGAGIGSGSLDEEYVRAGGKIVPKGADVFAEAELIG